MRVSMDEIIAMQKFRNKVNNTPLEEIEWDFPVDEQAVNDWKFIGLSNWEFALMHGVYQ